MLDWNHVRLFLEVARAGTLSAAATQLGTSVSTVQRHIGALEASVGVPLFQKGPRGYDLTAAGELLLPHAEQAEEALFAGQRALVGHDGQAEGELRVTLPKVLLPALAAHFAAFAETYPRLRLALQAADNRLSLDRETDIALRATLVPPESAVGIRVCELGWGRYVSRLAPEGDDDALPWVHYVGLDYHPAVHWRRDTFGEREPLLTVQGVIDMRSLLPKVPAQGLLPLFAGDPEPGLRRVGGSFATSELWLLVHADLRRSARARAFIDFVVPRLRADGCFSGT
jgi:DNA-binding transcriptional LysR family regulator